MTDAEIEAAYEQIGQQQAMAGGGGAAGGGGLPPLEQVRGEVSEQVRVQKEAGAMEELSQKLRAGADVTVHL